ncbi:hypothetical protein ACFGVR_14710 [Mucilaginibacter sp. AW1-3]
MNLLPNNNDDHYESDGYDEELDSANLEIEAGNFIMHEDVKKLLQDRRKSIKTRTHQP